MEDSDKNTPPITAAVSAEEPVKQKSPQERLVALIDSLLRIPINPKLEPKADMPPVDISPNGPKIYENVMSPKSKTPGEKPTFDIPGAQELFDALHKIASHAKLLSSSKSGDRIIAENVISEARKVLDTARPVLQALHDDEHAKEVTSLTQGQEHTEQLIERVTEGKDVTQSGEWLAAQLLDDDKKYVQHLHIRKAHLAAMDKVDEIAQCIDEIVNKTTGRQIGEKTTPPLEMQPGVKWTEKA